MPVLQPKRKQSASAKRCGFISIFFTSFSPLDLKIVCAVDANIHFQIMCSVYDISGVQCLISWVFSQFSVPISLRFEYNPPRFDF